MYSNTVSIYPTHFVRAVELITIARNTFNVPSENWPYPTRWRFGIPVDNYYAEVWCDGMDWQNSYWVLEESKSEDPVIHPFIIFDTHEEQNKFNSYDFDELIRGALYYRRDKLWIKSNKYGIYTDMSWPYIHLEGLQTRNGMNWYSYEHGSQQKVKFWMNPDFVPPEYSKLERPVKSSCTIGGG